MLLDIQNMGHVQIEPSLWGPITVFFLVNTFAMVGNIVATYISWPGERHYWILVVGRVLFIPFFLFCNYMPKQRDPLPVLFDNDYIYLAGSFLFSFTSGYCSSLALMFAPKYVSILLIFYLYIYILTLCWVGPLDINHHPPYYIKWYAIFLIYAELCWVVMPS